MLLLGLEWHQSAKHNSHLVIIAAENDRLLSCIGLY